ncbi:ABC transporter substrate-binding protein [Wenxinia saemankumensis]|uniref:Putative spermidine/putrescine transport system substrate-binding protein n=1 Tax=Wenxinia saemankumensis TaxID=1447782 RepID=A0A1M6DRU7_9RHOB|nr:ABC transporter substrate-binding protein [Wenxinia saemankumensis]SHI75903.1 putative spermidine/putrescine transport system substrate-binding protein [Wenxinia saemankumensis]
MTYRPLLAAMLAAPILAPAFAIGAAAQDAPTDWDSVVEEARGGEVNFFLWGGADNINAYVSDYVGGLLEEEYGITLNAVPLTDTADAVNLVLSEREAGVTEGGAVDLVWINGENFRTMKQGDLVWCGWTDVLPNDDLIDWENPAIANDFGVPVEGCEAPWSTAQFAFGYDSARTEEPPRSIPDLVEWVKANPGRFTYPAPPDFNGSAFVRHVFYHAAGGVDGLIGPFDQATYDAAAEEAWDILNEMEPHLWREGATYPTSITQLQQMFANREVDLIFDYNPSQFGVFVEDGTFPETTRSYGLDDGTIGNTNYLAIPANAANRAAAMVAVNVMLSGETQLEKARPGVWGAPPAIDVSRLPQDLQDGFGALPQHPSVVPAAELAETALPELQGEWVSAIDAGWQENVGR